jgi:uncharacterized membrane protein YhhN
MIITMLICIAIVTAGAAVYVKANNNNIAYIFLKLAATIFVIITALFSVILGKSNTTRYTFFIVIGLAFCLAGDITLLFPSQKALVLGIGIFSLSHCVFMYIFGFFIQPISLNASAILYTAAVFAVSISLYTYLYRSMGKIKIPGVLYTIILTLMLCTALTVNPNAYVTASQTVFIKAGALMFYISDGMLSISIFKHTAGFNWISLLFYWPGILLLALSTYEKLW